MSDYKVKIPPYPNCSVTDCMWPDVCVGYGKCHRPKKYTVADVGNDQTIDRLTAQIAMLRDAMATMLHIEGSGMAVMGWEAAIVKAHKALTATQADVEAWEKQRRDAVLEEAIRECQIINSDYMGGRVSALACADAILALKDTKP